MLDLIWRDYSWREGILDSIQLLHPTVESDKINSICFSNEESNGALATPLALCFVSHTSDLFGLPQQGVVC